MSLVDQLVLSHHMTYSRVRLYANDQMLQFNVHQFNVVLLDNPGHTNFYNKITLEVQLMDNMYSYLQQLQGQSGKH